VNAPTSDPGLGSGGRALLALRAEAAASPIPAPQPPGGVGPLGPGAAEKRGGKGLVVTAMAAVVVGIGFMVGIVVVLTGSHDKTPTAASAITPAPSDGTAGSPAASDAGSSSRAALAPVPGYTFEEAPASVIAELKKSFEDGFRSNLKPGVTVTPDDVLTGVTGRVVSRNGQKVALAVTMKFDDQWVARIGASDILAGGAAKLGATEHVTVSGTDAVYATIDGNEVLMAYKDGTFLIVLTDGGHRATLNEVMAGLIANLG